eukprot:UN06812
MKSTTCFTVMSFIGINRFDPSTNSTRAVLLGERMLGRCGFFLNLTNIKYRFERLHCDIKNLCDEKE